MLFRSTDNVVRYTVVVRSSSGAENVAYEGIRCDTGEVRRYAFGRKDATWGNARGVDWTPIRDTERNNYHRVLHREYFCVGRTASRNRNDILRVLRSAPARATDG